jgi:UDP-N-acetylmuramoylalanine--D-glutamate ligase
MSALRPLADGPRRLLVLGFGVTGRAVVNYAIEHSLSACVSEQGRLSEAQCAWLHERRIPYEQSGHTSRFLPEADAVVLSPGVSMQHPLVSEARRRHVAVISEMDLALSLAPNRQVVAVTGTNGKSSTVEVIGEILRSLKRRAWVAGNIGLPLISIVDRVSETDTLVLEVSSYQLEQSCSFLPHVGVLLNLSPDHLQRHGDMQSYAQAKSKVFVNQRAGDVAILPRALSSQFTQGKGRRVFYDELFPQLPAGSDGLHPHERANLRAAFAACDAVLGGFRSQDVPMQVIAGTFRLPHRMQQLGRVRDVCVINDSKSTNAASTIAALRSLDASIVLLLGGRHKGAGYDALVDEIAMSGVREVILFGEAAEALRVEFEQSPHPRVVPVVAGTMQDAVERGMRIAQPGDVLLLSPACSSFDAFSDYAERGDAFSAKIRAYPGFREAGSRT